jgi:Heparinase II/III-like protein/Heparinase II/III N-terminus
MLSRRWSQVSWLVKRLSRTYPGELPYRIRTVVRIFLQGMGFFTAKDVPSVDDTRVLGKPWVFCPSHMKTITTDLQEKVDQIMNGCLSIMGESITITNGIPQWNCDPLNGHAVPPTFGLALDFRHLPVDVDIRLLWEINRHVWWVPIAQAYAISKNKVYLDRLDALLRSWLDANPYPLGPNWSSPVEHGVRLINWSIVWHLIGGERSPLFEGETGQLLKHKWIESIYQHIHFSDDNYSFYSSADNHLIAEAAGVYVASVTWNYWERSEVWRARAKAILEDEIQKQFAPDGVTREQALCYQKFSLEFLIASALCGGASEDHFSPHYWKRLNAASQFLSSMIAVQGPFPFFGDSDNAFAFHLGYGKEFCAYRSIVAITDELFSETPPHLDAEERDTQAQWLYPTSAQHWLKRAVLPKRDPAVIQTDFSDGGYVLLGEHFKKEEEVRILFDVGALGYNRVAGHGHADALSICLSYRGFPFLVDSGTYCYNFASPMRRYFRSTAAHNTMLIDGVDQAEYAGSFLWLTDIHTTIEKKEFSEELDTIKANHDGYTRLSDPVRHQRELQWDKKEKTLRVYDSLVCKESHHIKLHWHLHPQCTVEETEEGITVHHGEHSIQLICHHEKLSRSVVRGMEVPPLGWVSERFNHKEPTTVLVFYGTLLPSDRIETIWKIGC